MTLCVKRWTTLRFQFTPLREGRQAFCLKRSAPFSISIHAPPRGATQGRCASCAGGYFNSRPSARGDDGWRAVLADWRHFNSRPSARGDAWHTVELVPDKLFQFTPLREGRLFQRCSVGDEWKISIHAPPRGATHSISCSKSLIVFQFTPLREGRPKSSKRIVCCRLFQFTPLREGRRQK